MPTISQLIRNPRIAVIKHDKASASQVVPIKCGMCPKVCATVLKKPNMALRNVAKFTSISRHHVKDISGARIDIIRIILDTQSAKDRNRAARNTAPSVRSN